MLWREGPPCAEGICHPTPVAFSPAPVIAHQGHRASELSRKALDQQLLARQMSIKRAKERAAVPVRLEAVARVTGRPQGSLVPIVDAALRKRRGKDALGELNRPCYSGSLLV